MEKKKTAAYCRVSTLNDSQDGSFEIQCEYFEKRIKADPAMEFAGVYGDHGLSGRSVKGRKELNRLIEDCEAGKVERILTKSIGRFARSMGECVEVIRHLSSLGVGIYFERERLDTLSMNGELILGILATIAEEESNSIARNCVWTRQKYLERGEPFTPARYGYISVGKDHRWEIVPDEAEVVRKAFFMAGMCYRYAIAIEGVKMLRTKAEYTVFERIDFWWLDDLVEQISFGQHTCTNDRTISIHWRCGLVSTLPSGVKYDIHDPRKRAEQWDAFVLEHPGRYPQLEEEIRKQKDTSSSGSR